jgi:hypothetical protein
VGASTRESQFLFLFAFTHFLEDLKDVLLFCVIDLRAVLASLNIGAELRTSDHLEVSFVLGLRYKDKRIGSIFDLLKCLEHVLKLRRKQELSLLLLWLLPEEEEQHERLQLFSILLLH